MTNTTKKGSLFTPFPVGSMPLGVMTFAADPSRVEMRLGTNDRDAFDMRRGTDTEVVVTDLITGERFIVAWAECGAGCRCAATAKWVHAETAESIAGRLINDYSEVISDEEISLDTALEAAKLFRDQLNVAIDAMAHEVAAESAGTCKCDGPLHDLGCPWGPPSAEDASPTCDCGPGIAEVRVDSRGFSCDHCRRPIGSDSPVMGDEDDPNYEVQVFVDAFNGHAGRRS